MGEGDQGGSGGKGGTGDQMIKVGEKEYNVADVENLLANVKTLTEKGESVQGIMDMCARYEMDPGEFLEQAQGGFATISKLITDGVIDEQGQVVKKKEGAKDDELNLDDPLKKKTAALPEDKTSEIVAKALEGISPTIKELGDEVKKMQNIQTSMIHEDYRQKIRTKHENLSDEDADKILGEAMNDPRKDLWAVAKEASTAKVASVNAIEKAYAEKHGLDHEALAKADENKLNEQSAEGGGAPKLKDKKIKLFGATKDGEVSAGDAAEAYFDKQLGGD